MGRLLLIRHAQASFLSQNYDQLSDLGEKQARLLGEYWAKRNTGFDRAWTGPCVRHKDTARLARDACVHAGQQFPEPVVVPEFDEYQGDEVLQRSLPRLLESSDRIRELHKAFEKSDGPYEKFKTFQKMFEAVISMWVDGKISPDGVESWTEFSIRVNQGLTQIFSASRHGGAGCRFHFWRPDRFGSATCFAAHFAKHAASIVDVSKLFCQRISFFQRPLHS